MRIKLMKRTYFKMKAQLNKKKNTFVVELKGNQVKAIKNDQEINKNYLLF